MPPAELVNSFFDTLKSLDWGAILFYAGIVLTAWAGFLTLSGLEGWILASSLGPWARGFILGAAAVGAGGGAVLLYVMDVPLSNRGAWIGMGVVAGVGGLVIARVTVAAFWKTWWLRIFLLGAVLGLVIYLAVIVLNAVGGGSAFGELGAVIVAEAVRRDDAGNMSANWPGIARMAISLAAGGAAYALAYQLFYPLLWLVRNGTVLAAGVVLLVIPPVRAALADFVGGKAGADGVGAVLRGEITLIAALAGGSYVLVAYAMWTQSFTRRFKALFRRVLGAERGSFGLFNMIGCSVGTTFSTMGRMLVLKRSAAEGSRLVKEEEEEEEEEEEDEEGERAKNGKKGKKKHAKKKSAGKKN